MPSKTFEVEGLGSVRITKRRGARHIRLSVTAKGGIRVSLPSYIPYAAGLKFALAKRHWLQQHLSQAPKAIFTDGALIGKSYRLKMVDSKEGDEPKVKLKGHIIEVSRPAGIDENHLKEKIEKICEKALRQDSKQLLSIRTDELAAKHGYEYKSLQIKKITSRWGSCSSEKRISLSLYLIQLPWRLIDYVILHELNHTVHLHHKADFWTEMDRLMPDVKLRRKQLKEFKPVVMPS